MKSLVVTLLFLLAACTGGGQPGFYSNDTVSGSLDELPTVTTLAPGYERGEFGPAWKDMDHNGCDNRSDVMRRDISIIRTKEGTKGCVVLLGDLYDAYTDKVISYERKSNSGVEVDHIVSLDDGWETGLDKQPDLRPYFANDPLNLITTDLASNRHKSAKAADEWLVPDNPDYRCEFVARQVSVKKKYHLSVTGGERQAMHKVLQSCEDQRLINDSEVAPPRAFPIGEPRR